MPARLGCWQDAAGAVLNMNGLCEEAGLKGPARAPDAAARCSPGNLDPVVVDIHPGAVVAAHDGVPAQVVRLQGGQGMA